MNEMFELGNPIGCWMRESIRRNVARLYYYFCVLFRDSLQPPFPILRRGNHIIVTSVMAVAHTVIDKQDKKQYTITENQSISITMTSYLYRY